VGRLSQALTLGLAMLVGCAGSRSTSDPCAAVTCAAGRVCVEGRCVSVELGLPFPDGAFDAPPGWPDGPGADAAITDAGGADTGGTKDTGSTKDTAAPKPDTWSPCPDPNSAKGGYAGSFVDGAGGTLAKGTVTFTLTAGTPPVMTLAGAIDGTALPGIMNYKIKGTLTGVVTCGVITTTLKGTLDGYGFDGVLNGTLTGKTAGGTWAGQQSGGGIAVSGTWTATHN